jgi:prepilin-type N-terminal cleavage/methylation domain-containing protein
LKKAFTLIDLLVVIAIIAILAAILFPVFAQAKLAAKKSVSLSNQKQIGLGIIMYAGDYDDTYPRNDGCTLNDSLNTAFNIQPAGTNPSPWCTGAQGYAFRDNHYSWLKWAMPYIKSNALFFHPVIQKDPTSWNSSGELEGGYAINLALTGALDGWIPGGFNPATKYGDRQSFVGGVQTAIPSPAEAMLIMEQTTLSAVGGYETNTSTDLHTLTYMPMAVREHWSGYFYKTGGTGYCKEQVGVVDPIATPFAGQVPLSYADGHTKTIAVGQFLANTPTAAQYGLSLSKYICPLSTSYYGNGKPVWTQPWPMWGLQ